MADLTVHNVRPLGAEPVDLVITGDRIDAVVAVGTGPESATTLDGRGRLALPGLINAHAHIDKSWWGMPWVSYGGEATTQGRIAHERAEREALGIPSVDSTVAVLREFLRHGTTATRTHVDVDLGVGLRGVESVLEAVGRLEGAIAVELVAFPQDGVLRRPGVLDLLDQAAAAGVASIGGIDPASLDRDPVAQLDGLFEIAVRRGVGIDIHLHDGGELGAFQYELLIERTVANGMQGRVVVSHGFALGDVAPARQAALVEQLANAGISWTTVAPERTAPLPWRQMLDRGMNLGFGTDGIRDLWSPYGDGDLLKIALGFARLHGLRTDEDLRRTVDLATGLAAPFVHRDGHGLQAGRIADVVLVEAENVQDALLRGPRREVVVAGGRVVVDAGELLL